MDLEGRAAIVTGGGTGVGRATCLALAARGCSVVVNYSRSKGAAEDTAVRAARLGAKSVAVRADVSVDADCRALVEAATRELGRLDVLVNNAGTTSFIPHGQLEKVTDADWTTILGVNLVGPFQCARAARPAMEQAGGGHIVNVSSVAGIAGTGSSIPYCAAKAGLNMLTVTLARALAPRIRVNAVAPGFIDGDWLRQGLGDAYDTIRDAVAQRSPLGRVCRAEDIADAILSLLTGSELVTGQVLPCDAGLLIAG